MKRTISEDPSFSLLSNLPFSLNTPSEIIDEPYQITIVITQIQKDSCNIIS